MTRLTFAPDLVEESVLLAERSAAMDRTFREERDRIYQINDERERESRFRALHLQYFAVLQLDGVVARALQDRPEVASRVEACRVVRAHTRRDEGADLVDEVISGHAHRAPTLVLRLRPTLLVEPETLKALLNHELTHIGDMLSPMFGYERHLPPSEEGPTGDNILRDRYRVVWDATIDGRLTRAGLTTATAREFRAREFSSTFAMLGARCRTSFERWFDEQQPTHARIVAFVTSPLLSEVSYEERCGAPI